MAKSTFKKWLIILGMIFGVLALFFALQESIEEELNYCKEKGWDGVSSPFSSHARCYKLVKSDTGTGYEIEYSGLIRE